MERLELKISGVVQGVSYRAACKVKAQALGLTGWVCNNPDGTVTAVAEGERENLEALQAWTHEGPSAAKVSDVEPVWGEAKNEFDDFTIHF